MAGQDNGRGVVGGLDVVCLHGVVFSGTMDRFIASRMMKLDLGMILGSVV